MSLTSAYIVDDSSDYRLLLRHFLKRFLPECHIEVFEGPQALFDHLSQLEGNRDSQVGLPSVIIMDYNMPVIDGLTALKLLKQPTDPSNNGWKSIPVLLNSNGASGQIIKKCLDAGADGFLDKTADFRDLEVLKDTISNYLCA